jgi:hypothetical protein
MFDIHFLTHRTICFYFSLRQQCLFPSLTVYRTKALQCLCPRLLFFCLSQRITFCLAVTCEQYENEHWRRYKLKCEVERNGHVTKKIRKLLCKRSNWYIYWFSSSLFTCWQQTKGQLTLWRRSSSKFYLRIQSVPKREHHTSPLQTSTG